MDKIYTIDELEAKLAKAVEAIDRALWDMDIGYDISAFRILKAALAELKGQDADALAALELIRQEERELTVKSCTHYCTDCGHVVPLGDDGRGSCGHGRIYDVRPEAIERVKRVARNEARREAAGVLTDETELSRLARNAILVQMEEPDDE